MTGLELFFSTATTTGAIASAMAVLAAIEAAAPLQPRSAWHALHRRPNLALTALTIAISALCNAALVLGLDRLSSRSFGLLPGIGIGALPATLLVVIGLDFAFYVLHRLMHGVAAFWRFHEVHHSDPAVDVTTTIRQHPGETILRYLAITVGAILLGASPQQFAVYRLWSVLAGLLEHANVRLPSRLDDLLALLIVSPNLHKVHHSRDVTCSDTNFGNCFSAFDRLFGTFTPAREGRAITYGIYGFDDSRRQTTMALLAHPWQQALSEAAAAPSRPSQDVQPSA